MARVQFGALVTNMTGSTGGWTFQNSAAGSVARLRSGTLKNSSDIQTIAHSSLGTLLQAWQNLSTPDQQLWNVYAALHPKTNRYGKVKKVTGMNLFTSVNYFGNMVIPAVDPAPQLISPPVIQATPPPYVLPVAVPTYNVIATATELKINFPVPFIHTNDKLIINVSPPLTRTTTQNRQEIRPIAIIPGGTDTTIDIKPAWEARNKIPWPPAPGKNCFSLVTGIMPVSGTSGQTGIMTRKTTGVSLV